MRFRLLKEVEGEVNCYGQMCETGGTIQLDGHLAEKAKNNPDFETIRPGPKKKHVDKS